MVSNQQQQQQQPIRRVDLVHHATLDSKDKPDPYKYGTGVESRPFRYGFASVERAIGHQEQRKARAEKAAADAAAAAAAASATDSTTIDPVATSVDVELDDGRLVESSSEHQGQQQQQLSSSENSSIRRVDLVHTVFDAPKEDHSGKLGYIPAVERKLRYLNETSSSPDKARSNDETGSNKGGCGCFDSVNHIVASDDMYNTRHKRVDLIAPNGGAYGVAPDAAYQH